MYRIVLINMPFANLGLPSIALTQLKAVTEERFRGEVEVELHYFNQDFARYLGLPLYSAMTGSLAANNSGLGDWFFRRAAFPEQPDNVLPYFQRYFPAVDEDYERMKGVLLAKRAGLLRFMQRLVQKNRLGSCDLVGFTSMFAQNVASFAMARMVKQSNPKVVTVVGGANCEAPMGREIAAHVEAVDFVFSGPALVSFSQFLSCQLHEEHEECQRLKGVFCRQNLDSSHLQGAGSVGADLPIEVEIPLDYDSFLSGLEEGFPEGQVKPSLTFETSRGCWWGERSHCTFCGLNGGSMAYRAVPSAQALEMFQSLFSRYAERCLRYEAVDNIMPRNYIQEVFAKLDSPPGVSLFYEVKADLKEHEMEILGRAGVTAIQPGIESLATSTLKLMGKGTTAYQNVAFLKNCITYGITPAWNLLIGFPRESAEVYQKYLDDMPLLVHLPPPAGAFPVRFDRFSPYFVRAEEFGLDLSPYEFYRYIYPFPEECLSNLAYYFEDRNYSARYLAEMVTWRDRLSDGVASWSRRYEGTDGGLRAELKLRTLDDQRAWVEDSRSGEPQQIPLDPSDLSILAEIDQKGRRAEDIARATELPLGMVEDRLAALSETRLVFQEEDRYLSLVLPAARSLADPEAADMIASKIRSKPSLELS